MSMFICMDDNNTAYVGKTLKEAWDMYEKDCADEPFSYLKFYRVEPISVELVEKPATIKVPTIKAPTKKGIKK